MLVRDVLMIKGRKNVLKIKAIRYCFNSVSTPTFDHFSLCNHISLFFVNNRLIIFNLMFRSYLTLVDVR